MTSPEGMEFIAIAVATTRARIAGDLERKMMPLCVCQRCDNIEEAALVERAIRIVRGLE